MEDYARSPGADLVAYRIRKGLTLRDLSKQTGLSPATLHRLERGLIKPSMRSRILLQDGLGLTRDEVDRLLGLAAAATRAEIPAAAQAEAKPKHRAVGEGA